MFTAYEVHLILTALGSAQWNNLKVGKTVEASQYSELRQKVADLRDKEEQEEERRKEAELPGLKRLFLSN